jgi:hypothetical protein
MTAADDAEQESDVGARRLAVPRKREVPPVRVGVPPPACGEEEAAQ